MVVDLPCGKSTELDFIVCVCVIFSLLLCPCVDVLAELSTGTGVLLRSTLACEWWCHFSSINYKFIIIHRQLVWEPRDECSAILPRVRLCCLPILCEMPPWGQLALNEQPTGQANQAGCRSRNMNPFCMIWSLFESRGKGLYFFPMEFVSRAWGWSKLGGAGGVVVAGW